MPKLPCQRRHVSNSRFPRKPPRPKNNGTTGRQSIAPDKSEDFLGELLRLLHVRKMAGALDRLEAGARNGGAIGAAVGLGEHAVVHAPKEQRRNADAVQTAPELRVMHVRRPGV